MLDADGVDGGRIDHFGAEVAELHCLDVGQFWNDVCRADDARIGCHETIHVGPYLEHACIQCRSDDAGGVVASASAQVCHLATLGISADEAAYNANLWNLLPSLANQFVGQFPDEAVLAGLELSLDEFAAVEPLRSFYQRCNNQAAYAFAVGDDGSLCFGAQVVDEINALIDAAQLFQQFSDVSLEFVAFLAGGYDGVYHLLMSSIYLLERLLVECITLHCHLACLDELVGDAAQGTDHHDDRLCLPFDNLLYTEYAFYGTDRSSTKFYDFHPRLYPVLFTFRVQRYK